MTKSADYPEILADLSVRITECLVKHGIERKLAGEVAGEATEEMRHHWGGQLIYVPQGLSFEKRKEYESVWKAFSGDNHSQLARQFKRSVSQIYRIVEIMRIDEMRKRQTDMFAPNDTEEV